MKSSELMVGDYIVFDGSPYIVEEISAKGWIHILDTDNKARVALSSDYILDFIEGIPLTPEILEKIGFVSVHNVGYILDISDGTKVIYDSWNKNLIILNGYKTCLDIVSYWPMDVHELQHALRLCRIEKEVIL